MDNHLDIIHELDLIEHTSPVQHTIRLLIPEGSRLLDLDEVRDLVGPFDPAGLAYPWENPDPRVDGLQRDLTHLVTSRQELGKSRTEIFGDFWSLTYSAMDLPVSERPENTRSLATIPFLTEPWYC